MNQSIEPTLVACASALPAHSALLRVSGGSTAAVLQRCGLPIPQPWRVQTAAWSLPLLGVTPCRVQWSPAGRSYTGFDQAEIIIPGAADLVTVALDALIAAGAEAAPPGAFTRQALASGRLSLDQAEAVLAVAQASDAAGAQAALQRLRGGLSAELEPVRQRLLELRARVEAGLDFIDEEDVRAYDPVALQAEMHDIAAVLQRWVRAAGSLGAVAEVCLAGPANAGKSALFAALTGQPALVSDQAGTTRDWLTGNWEVNGRLVRLIDTAGWSDALANGEVDAAAIAAGRERLHNAALVLWCSAPDARLSERHQVQRAALPGAQIIIATKADLGAPDPAAVLAVSVGAVDQSAAALTTQPAGLAALTGLVARELAAIADGDPRQQQLLQSAISYVQALAERLPDDVVLADQLAAASDALGDLLGVTTADEVLGAIFSRFCIGK